MGTDNPDDDGRESPLKDRTVGATKRAREAVDHAVDRAKESATHAFDKMIDSFDSLADRRED